AAPRRPPRHDLPLPPGRRLRRAPHDAPPAGGARPAHPGGAAGHHPRARRSALAARRVRQQRRRRPLLRPRLGAALRQLRAPGPRAGRGGRPAARRPRGQVALRLRAGGRGGPQPLHRAPLRGPGPRGGPLGAALRARGRPHGHAGAAVRDDARRAPRLRLRRAGERRHAAAAPDVADRQRDVPRLRGADDRGGALARPRCALRFGLPVLAGARRPQPRRRRRDPRLGARVPTRRRLGGVRPHQRHRRQPRPDPRRRGARRFAGGAAVGQLDRLPRRQPRDGGGGPRHLRRPGGREPAGTRARRRARRPGSGL
ncbi:MAG: Bll2821 protein, partial [uncultured Acetobacteraceae bacterium]